MAVFSELIKKFDKIRDFMRDFYIYGFKHREDFTKKSYRSYDNEKRRIASYMGEYMKWEYKNNKKKSFISLDCSKIPINPLYAAFKSKSFTSNDIMLHFYILNLLKTPYTISQVTNEISLKTNHTFDIQTVRNKCVEYTKNGLLISFNQGKNIMYQINNAEDIFKFYPNLFDAISFFQGAMPFGEIGSFILDLYKKENSLFVFKHQFIAHALDDLILLEILTAIRKNYSIIFENQNSRTGYVSIYEGVPLKIFVGAYTGRRYLCVYKQKTNRFFNYRLDYIKNICFDKIYEDFDMVRQKLNDNLNKVWGVSFGGKRRLEIICMKLFIDEENENHIIKKIEREGQGGELIRLKNNIFLYTKELFDSNDISPWIKTFTGRILAFEGTNKSVIERFYNDIEKLKKIYEK